MIAELEHRQTREVAFSPDGRFLAASGHKSRSGPGKTGDLLARSRIWSTVDWLPIGPPLTHTERIYAMEFSPDSSLLATGSWDQSVKIWNTRDASPHGAPIKHKEDVHGIAFHPSGKRLATACFDGTVRLLTKH